MPKETLKTFNARLDKTFHTPIIKLAYIVAKYAHRHDYRKEVGSVGNRTRYFEHSRRVAIMVMDEMGCYDSYVICVALLHDVLEDSKSVDTDVIKQAFGSVTFSSVKLLSKEYTMGGEDVVVPHDTYVKSLFSPRGAWDAVLVKLCDRVDNMRHLESCSEDFIRKQVKETSEEYIHRFRQYAKRIPDEYIHNYIKLVAELEKICEGYHV